MQSAELLAETDHPLGFVEAPAFMRLMRSSVSDLGIRAEFVEPLCNQIDGDFPDERAPDASSPISGIDPDPFQEWDGLRGTAIRIVAYADLGEPAG